MLERKILVADDEKDLVQMLVFHLESCGYKAISAYDGKSALEIAEKERPDLVILDIAMPVMNGFEALTRLRSNPKTKDTPVIMLTCKGESKAIFRAQGLGATDYIIKPFNSSELLEIIKKYI